MYKPFIQVALLPTKGPFRNLVIVVTDLRSPPHLSESQFSLVCHLQKSSKPKS